MKNAISCFLLSAIALIGPPACSSSSGSPSPPCNANPWECPAGQTCWPKDSQTFACLISGPGKAGDTCLDVVDSPSCGDGLSCFQTAAGAGTCTPYCDPMNPAHACGAGQVCTLAILGGGAGPQFHICIGSRPPADAGAD
jgi:hypothetical protein